MTFMAWMVPVSFLKHAHIGHASVPPVPNPPVCVPICPLCRGGAHAWPHNAPRHTTACTLPPPKKHPPTPGTPSGGGT